MRKILLLLLLVASPALAQRDDRNYGQPGNTVENQRDMALAQFVFCAEPSAHGLVGKVLASTVGSDDESRAVKKLIAARRDCSAAYRLPFTPTAVHNALATLIYRREHRDDPLPTNPAPTDKAPVFAVVPAGTAGTGLQQTIWFVGTVANCVAFFDPASTHRLVTGPIDVPEEDKRFGALGATLARCEAADGPKLSVRLMRGFLADAMLRRVSGNKTAKD